MNNKYILLVLIYFALLPATAFAQVVITDVMCNPVGSDADGEWVKIKNTGTENVDITGWKFNDGSNHILNVPPDNGGTGDMVLDVDEEVMLANKADKVSGVGTIIDTVMSLSNSGDTLKLIDADGTEVNTVTYTDTDVVEGESCFTYVGSQEGESNNEADTITTQTNIITTEVIKYNTVTVEPPQDIHLRVTMPEVINTGTYARFFAEVYDATGAVAGSANTQWVFGDGAVARGKEVRHKYGFAGNYAVAVSVNNGELADEVMRQIQVIESDVDVLLDDKYDFVEIINNSQYNLDLSGWMLRSGYRYFNIPDRTVVLPSSHVRFSTEVTKLSTLSMEKYVLLLDAVRKLTADSRDYIAPEEQEKPIIKSQLGNNDKVDTVYSVVQDSSGAWYVAENTNTTVPQYNDVSLEQEEEVLDEIVNLNEDSQLAAAVVGTKGVNFFDSGIEWLFGLFSVLGLGLFTLNSFASSATHASIDDEHEHTNYNIIE